MSYFSKTFDLNKVTLLPTLGNNDMFVHDEMNVAGKDKDSKNILEDLKKLWKPLNLNLTSDFSNGGYFAQNIANGPSIISLNSMYFFTDNTEIPDCNVAGSPGAKELAWLEGQLQEAQRSNKKAYIMSHVPPVDKSNILYKSKCYSQYVDMLGKYSNVIAAHLTGHTNGRYLIWEQVRC
jgi:Calcineurin-like phosphoesterase